MFFERPQSGERAVLVHLDLGGGSAQEDPRELEELVLSAGGDPVEFVFGQRDRPDPGHFVGSGKLLEIEAAVRAHDAALVIFNHALSPSQERNLERALGCRVVDRTGLILDIFAQRARSHVGKLQVELAQLRHMSTRLVRGWTHLERQKGGIGLRGPGETQLETDRRLLRDRIRLLLRRLEKVHSQREQGRRARQRAEVPTVSLVGYTNAGKSTLFNTLTGAGVYAADQLFATLDPTMRRCTLPDGRPVVLADTVGFVRHLPHQLVEAFRATLEEARLADLLLHVIDASAADREDTSFEVEKVLGEIGADKVRRLDICNKIDLLEAAPRIDRGEDGKPVRVWVSAQSGAGLELLREAIAELLEQDLVHECMPITPAQGRLRARLYEKGAVLAEHVDEQGQISLEIRLPRVLLAQLLAAERPDGAARPATGHI
ncbi:MAG: GTPase HflX [Pseudomonadales bacterium]|nr:GTPase HflX [Pseudomonadales bacterium]MBP9033550.1 GTPase HflX [Pseudomonadales bacterium]